MGSLSIWHWALVILVIVLLFGRGKISDLMGDVAKGISEMDGMQIFNLVKHEQPQTIAFLLSYLDNAKAYRRLAEVTTQVQLDALPVRILGEVADQRHQRRFRRLHLGKRFDSLVNRHL